MASPAGCASARASRARSCSIRIVLFDEPDSGLDPVRTALSRELIKEVHAENGGGPTRTRDAWPSTSRSCGKGRIVESGPAAELFASENPFVRQFLSGGVRRASRMSEHRPAPAALAGVAARRPVLTIALAGSARAGGAVFALKLNPTAATNTFVSSSSSEYRADAEVLRELR